MDETSNSGKELHRLETLLDAARLLNSTLELKEITQVILDVVRTEVPVERLSVFVVDRVRNSIHSLVAQGVGDFEISLPIGTGIAGTVAATGEILDILDAYADERFEPRFDQELHFHTKDLFALPVYNRQGDIAGVLQLLNRERPITEADREFLLGISVYIGLALQNAWAHAQLRAKGLFDQELVVFRDNLAEAEQVSLTSELFHHVVQEISNPLAVAIGYAELARNQEPLPKELRIYLEKVSQGLDQTAEAVRRFRQFIGAETDRRAPLSLEDVLRRISELRANEWSRNNIEASLVAQPVPDVVANERQLQLVILYLIKSAEQSLIKSNGKRELHLEISGTESVRIEIHDNGQSRITNMRQYLSQSPMSGGSPASGGQLELSIAASIVQQHNGRIQLQEAAEGNTVIIELPAHSKDLIH
jgi:signal transduction histidine kinase